MKEINVANITFKVKDYLPYTDLDKLNLYGLVTTQAKLQKYKSMLPKGDSIQDVEKKLQEMLNNNKIDDKTIAELAGASQQMKAFNRKIDELLIVEPKLADSRPTVIMKLKNTPEYKTILKAVMDDISAIMNPEEEQTPKKE